MLAGGIMAECEVCQVAIPAGDEARELHETGKRHMRIRAQKEVMSSLVGRSVFLKWHQESGHKITKEEVEHIMSQFGKVDRVLFRDESLYAIVEYSEADKNAVGTAISTGKVTISETTITITERKMQFSGPAEEKRTIDVSAVCQSACLRTGFVAQIDFIIEQIVISQEQMEKRQVYAQRLQDELARYFINPKVQVFGSSITTIGTSDSDVDACLELLPPDIPIIPELNRDKMTLLTCDPSVVKGRKVNVVELLHLPHTDRARFVCKIMNEIRKEVGWIGHQRPVLDARCPVVRFVADKHVLIDLSVDNRLGCAKSEYLKLLIEQESSGNLRRILLAFRFWALANGLLDPIVNQHKGHFNAYMLNLLVIGYMQTLGLIPKIHFSPQEVLVGRWRIDFEISPFTLEQINLEVFFRKMFVYFAEFSFGKTVYLIQTGAAMSVDDFLKEHEHLKDHFKPGLMNVQDPLELSHNVCQNIVETSVGLMRRRMMFALARMKKSRDSFCDLLNISEVRPISSNSNGEYERESIVHDMPKVDIEMAKVVVGSLLEEVLGFEPDIEPSKKRLRLESETDVSSAKLGVFSVHHQLYVGRRNVRRKMAAEHPTMDELTLEREVSRQLLHASKGDELVVRLRVAISVDDGILRVLYHRLDGNAAELTNIAHFFEQLLLKNKLRIAAEMGAEPDEISKENFANSVEME